MPAKSFDQIVGAGIEERTEAAIINQSGGGVG
jgi:hypothetical protein